MVKINYFNFQMVSTSKQKKACNVKVMEFIQPVMDLATMETGVPTK